MSTNYNDYTGRKVTIQLTEGKAPVEGTVESGSDRMVLVKVKGKSSAVMIFASEVADLQLQATDQLEASKLKPVKLSNVRRHLLNAHGWTLSRVNALDESEAMTQHTGLHEAPDANDLGHKHGEDDDSDA